MIINDDADVKDDVDGDPDREKDGAWQGTLKTQIAVNANQRTSPNHCQLKTRQRQRQTDRQTDRQTEQ